MFYYNKMLLGNVINCFKRQNRLKKRKWEMCLEA